jgi:hypothetical protein
MSRWSEREPGGSFVVGNAMLSATTRPYCNGRLLITFVGRERGIQ